VDHAATSAAGEPVLRDRPLDGVLRLRLNRPDRHNAVDGALLAALHAGLERPDARAVVIGSAAADRFCAGADLAISDAERTQVSAGLYRLYDLMLMLDVPLIAALSGPAVGGGAQIAIACDLRVAAPAAWLRFVGPAHGLAVGAWGLPSLVGRGRALELCLTGRRVDAEEALGIGLVDRVADDADAAALELAAQLAELDGPAVARVKAVIARAAGCAPALALEADGNGAWAGAVPSRHQ
jgi:enoyl-CoA hydratase/carnithine racemase